MIPQRNPNAWSCLPTAFAIALDLSVNDLLEKIGHDGSDITHVGLPDPLKRRGFHPQELIKVCLESGLSATRVELFPTSVPCSALLVPDKPIQHDVGGWLWFKKNLFDTRGVIECRNSVGTGHAMAYDGMGDYAMILDPATGNTFEFREPDDADRRNRFLVALWRLK